MKKILPFILILSIFVNLFTPFSVARAEGNETTKTTNETESPEEQKTKTTHEDYSANFNIKTSKTDKEIYVTVSLKEGLKTKTTTANYLTTANLSIKAWLVKKDGEKKDPDEKTSSPDYFKIDFYFGGLTKDTEYQLYLRINEHRSTSTGSMYGGIAVFDNESPILDLGPYTIITAPTEVTEKIDDQEMSAEIVQKKEIMPECGLYHLGGCAAQFLYSVFFVPTSFLFALAGTFFDNTFAYSVNSDSYTNPFITKGWGLMRDFCNMFFIFVLVYIAIGTILQLNSVKTKDMMISVIVIGIFINFSLFAAQVVVDTSNIMARVFYNSETIKLSKEEEAGATDVKKTPSYVNGIIPLSEAIVTKINPQKLILSGEQVGKLPNKGGQEIEESSRGEVSTGTFILITLLATAVNVVGMIVFLSIGLVFVTRVVGLWVAMILAPVAFFTYMIPSLQNQEMIGWKRWWADLVKLSFLAPVFIFFLYLILQFLESDLGIIQNENSVGVNFVMGIMLPFVFIMVLLMKAKSIAVKMSGDWGAAVSKIGASAGGLAVGAMTGGAAMLGRATVGRMGSSIANSETVKKWAGSKNIFSKFAGNKIMDAGQSVGKKSFDFRNTKLGGNAAKSLGTDLGKGKTGGYQGAQDAYIKKRIERAERLKLSPEKALEQDKKAKDWKKKYEEALVNKMKLAKQKGEIFTEGDRQKFENEYTTNGVPSIKKDASGNLYEDTTDITKPEDRKKVLTADETNRDMMTKQAEQAGKESISNKNTRASIIKDLKSKGKPEKEEPEGLERYKLETRREEAENVKKEALEDINKINDDLKKIAEDLGKLDANGNPDPSLLTKDVLEGARVDKLKLIDDIKNTINELRESAKNPKSPEIDNYQKTISEANRRIERPTSDLITQKEAEILRAEETLKSYPESTVAMRELTELKQALEAEKQRVISDATNEINNAQTEMELEKQRIINEVKTEITRKQGELRTQQEEANLYGSILKDKAQTDTVIRKQNEIIDSVNAKFLT